MQNRGQRIRALRESLGLLQREMASALGFSQRKLSSLETEFRKLSLDDAGLITEFAKKHGKLINLSKK